MTDIQRLKDGYIIRTDRENGKETLENTDVVIATIDANSLFPADIIKKLLVGEIWETGFATYRFQTSRPVQKS